jgi:hypothetical protein
MRPPRSGRLRRFPSDDFLALAPLVDGPPYWRLDKAYAEGHEMRFWARHSARDPGGAIRWTRMRTVLRRYLEQLEFKW